MKLIEKKMKYLLEVELTELEEISRTIKCYITANQLKGGRLIDIKNDLDEFIGDIRGV